MKAIVMQIKSLSRCVGLFLSASSAQRSSLLVGLALAAGTSGALGQDLGKRPGPQETPVAIVNATIHPVSGPVIEKGYVLFDKGVITEVGPMGEGRVFIATTRQIDAAGKHVYPGLITPYSRLGLEEIQSVRASTDYNEAGDITPEVRSIVSVNPDSTLLPVTRTNGVLSAGVFPAGGTIAGRASVIRLEGWTWEDMAVSRDIGIVISWPMMRTVTAPWMDQSEEEQRKQASQRLDRIRETIRLAKAYAAQRPAGGGKGGRDGGGDGGGPAGTIPVDVRWEAMRSAVVPAAAPGGVQSPCFIEAQDYDQITSAIAFCLEQKLRPVIVGGHDAPLCAELLKTNGVPVIVNTIIALPNRDDAAYDDNYSLPARLHAAGISFCIASGEETAHERNLPYAAGMAVAHGLPQDVAIRAVTLSSAEILGVAGTLGSLEKGKEATLIITSGNPLEVTTKIEGAFIAGKQIDLSNKQSVLAEKYREKYKQQKAAGPQADPQAK